MRNCPNRFGKAELHVNHSKKDEVKTLKHFIDAFLNIQLTVLTLRHLTVQLPIGFN